MNITVGPPATGEKFYKREKLITKLWKKINYGGSLLMAAPRRLGKTSIMQYIQEHPQEGYEVMYIITE